MRNLSAPEPKYPDLLPAATEKDVRYLPVDAGHGPVVSGAEHMEDGLTDALEDGFPMVAVAHQQLGGRGRPGRLPVYDLQAPVPGVRPGPTCWRPPCGSTRGRRPVRGRADRRGAERPGWEVWSDLLRKKPSPPWERLWETKD